MIRVQMVSDGIPAYQKDFEDEDEALATAGMLARGGQMTGVDSVADLACYESNRGHVRAFRL